MRRELVIIPILLVSLLVMPVASVNGYSDVLTPGLFGNTTITWEIIEAPSVPFSLFWVGTEKWFVDTESYMTFTVTNIHEDVEGQLQLGNLTIVANDTAIAQDLTLGVWGLTPFLPGLVIKNDLADIAGLNQTALDSAERVLGNYLNGSMEIELIDYLAYNGISYSCVSYFYEQDPTGFGSPQRTFLVYDMDSGILVHANTTYSFGTLYSLILELSSISSPDQIVPLVVLGVGITIVVIVVVVKLVRK